MYCFIFAIAFVLAGCANGPTVAEQTATIEVLSMESQAQANTQEAIQLTANSTPTPTIRSTDESIIYTGSGNGSVDIPANITRALVHITGNAIGRQFVVSAFDFRNEEINRLVDSTAPYNGVRPLDFLLRSNSVHLEITAVGEWKIEILNILSGRTLVVPGMISGSSDDVIRLQTDSTLGEAIIDNKSNQVHYFTLDEYTSSLTSKNLVNTGGAYTVIVGLDPNTVFLEITSEDDWIIEVTIK